ncbi:hypothetical protein [uncultured Microbulbifer sp.]|uniref:hypothetical protein n=1 Tax=uncultured Microbulbifer sp. TaxID=348147 RepID=UPI0026147906|nr:hypothetical protein [uncultured Microbulbifer sp.]
MTAFDEIQEIVAGSNWRILHDKQGVAWAVEIAGEQTILNRQEPVNVQTWRAISEYVDRRRAQTTRTGDPPK